MRVTFDRKIFLSLVGGFLVTGIPLLYDWYADTISLEVRLLSIAALEPDNKSHFQGLKFTINSIPVTNPYLSVLKITNDGSRPIPAELYERPIEIKLNEAKVVRSEITETVPSDLKAQLSVKDNVVQINPLLLNPDDSITIAIITSDAKPSFSPTARIAGVKKINEIDVSFKEANRQVIYAGLVLCGTLVIIICALFLSQSGGQIPAKGIHRSVTIISFVSGGLIGLSLPMLGVNSIAKGLVVTVLVLVMLGTAIAFHWLKIARSSER